MAILHVYANAVAPANLIGEQPLSNEDLTIGTHSVRLTNEQTHYLLDTTHEGESIIPVVKMSYGNDTEVNFTGTPYTHP